MAKNNKTENSKRIKITFDSINFQKGFKPSMPEGFQKMDPVELQKKFKETQKEDEKKVKADKLRYEKDLKIEENRFKNLPCPVCKNKNKDRKRITHMDGPVIYGGRNSVDVLADYLICQNCGVMYVDLHKKEVAPAYRGMFAPRLMFE